MSMHRGRIERRLFDAVLVVLASAGCQPAPAGPVTPVAEPGPLVTPPVDAAPTPPATPDPVKLCAAHHPALPASTAWWDGNRGIATCGFVKQTVTTTTEVMFTPECCPQGRPHNMPCPGPEKRQVPATKHLMEIVELRSDGTVVSAKESWTPLDVQEPHRHNCGRRPEGLHHEGELSCDDDTGAHLALMAELEAASVPAFERLARELAAYGAPDELVRRAERAMRDEIRHARVMTALAARHGATPRATSVTELPCRTLTAIARENAIEGCVREAYGALVATFQAERADVALRAAFAAIARDERRHAALSEDVHAWLVTQLSAVECADLDNARAAAELELRASLGSAPACAELGLPSSTDAVALFDAYFAA